MKALFPALLLFATTLFAQAQNAAAPATFPPQDIGVTLASIEQTAYSTTAQLQATRIDKWKTESSQKQQAQQNAESLTRNLTAALPGMVAAVRTSPNSMAANFKLYRNITALYDVLLPLTESAGAFGQKGEFQALGDQLERWDQIRRSHADYLERLAAQKDAATTAAAGTSSSTSKSAKSKKIIVDDEPAPSKSKKSKKK
jgi:hypothetical protein